MYVYLNSVFFDSIFLCGFFYVFEEVGRWENFFSRFLREDVLIWGIFRVWEVWSRKWVGMK